MESSRLEFLLGLVRIEGLGSKRINLLLDKFSSPEIVWNAPFEKLKEVEGIGDKLAMNIISSRKEIDLRKEMNLVKQAKVDILSVEDEVYPKGLKEIYTPPTLLFCKGDLELLKYPMLGVVGTRSPTRYGYEVLKNIIPELTKAGIVIVSGLAKGIDGMAHELCLKNNGKTVAVLGNGIDRVYPPEHNELYKRISNEGLILTEYSIGKSPSPGNFPARNRIISGLSKAVLVVEAPQKSGAIITAEQALDQNKDIMVIPGNITSPKSKGCNKLMAEGAKPVLNAKDILEEFGLEEVYQEVKKENNNENVNIDYKKGTEKILEKIPQYPYKLHLEELFLECSVTYEIFIQEMLELELNGYIIKQAGGYISRIK
ncbi:DNA-processing protein DprA [Natranaerofaba carboxydovora]|uniref:DNA-processing protein DprA n=1 Tax=Natranaerofaba carboxydovora TaxID=2742683 RepID=UPI001F142D5C|nr:DNA-processing protein DprA [Natranaerofaba carboxydovora]UMZ73346.1 DNA processing protein DprA [Natranaerofaba carboxydovora]